MVMIQVRYGLIFLVPAFGPGDIDVKECRMPQHSVEVRGVEPQFLLKQSCEADWAEIGAFHHKHRPRLRGQLQVDRASDSLPEFRFGL